ncbi:Uncharacterized protein TCM_005022 [Theobroma cacao]|uniref:Uncharacterized protein n=1 Tax=Theobroma cacao TaxID=3641 RepID=A0A061DRX8_THECC|nr:Uncharacterized protein TCM_005022 [Theobroma cacao]
MKKRMVLHQRGMGYRYVAVLRQMWSPVSCGSEARRGVDVKCDVCGSCGAAMVLGIKSFRLLQKLIKVGVEATGFEKIADLR